MSDEPVIVGHIRRACGLRGEVVVEPASDVAERFPALRVALVVNERRPSEATVMPLPTDETTPPLTKMYFDTHYLPARATSAERKRNRRLPGKAPPTVLRGAEDEERASDAH